MLQISSLKSSLKQILKAKGYNITDNDDVLLEYEIKRAISEINRDRRFEPTDTILYDSKYEDLIIPLSVSAFSKNGAEGESSHSENGVSRNYTSGGDYPKEELAKIIPLIK